MLNKTKILKNKIYDMIHKLKLTTRITVFNVILFTLMTLVIYLFVMLLTNQFLFFKNRDELLTKRLQIEEFIDNQYKGMSVDYPVMDMYESFKSLYLFDNYKHAILMIDSEGHNSYSLDEMYYSRLLGTSFDDYASQFTLNLEIKNETFLELSMVREDGELVHDTYFNLGYSDNAVFTEKVLDAKVMHTTIKRTSDSGTSYYFILFFYPEYDESFLSNLNSALIVSSLIGIVLITLFGKYFTRRALKPLVKLSYTAQNINYENLSYQIPEIGTDDEVDTLIKSLNLMLQNLDKSFNYQRRFVSDASHELRIPLTIILGYTDILKTMGYQDKELLEESLESIESEAKNMQSLVEKLLLLARIENRSFEINYEKVILEDTVSKIVNACKSIYTDFDFVTQFDYKGYFMVDVQLLTQMLRALIENAVKYSEEDHYIKVTSSQVNRYTILSISDHGRGIPAEAIPQLTNRFYRVDEDRNRKTGGSGLGLSIVDSLMKLQGGKIQIESAENEGTTIHLYFPKDSFSRNQ